MTAGIRHSFIISSKPCMFRFRESEITIDLKKDEMTYKN